MEELLGVFGTKAGIIILFSAIVAAILCYGVYLVLPYLVQFGFGWISGIIFCIAAGLGQLSYIQNKNKVNLIKKA